jgi:hypothetical protein
MVQSGNLLFGFVLSNRYRKLEDSRLNALIGRIRILLALQVVFFLLMLIAAWGASIPA